MPGDPSSLRMFASFAAGSESAADRIFQRYVKRLSRLAHTRLTPRVAARVDPEDIVMSAWRSFFVGSRQNQFDVDRSGDLWALLARITLLKLYRAVERHTAQKRSVDQEAPLAPDDRELGFGDDREPTPEEAVALSDYVEHLLQSLTPRDQRIAELRLQGELIEDIAIAVQCSEKTVRRSLQALRGKLTEAAGESPLPMADQSETQRTPVQHSPSVTTTSEIVCSLPQVSFASLTLTRLIGQGGMGKVYHADLDGADSAVAVKFLHRSFQQNQEAVQRLLREAEIIHQLDHPGIVGLRGIGRTAAGVYFVVMDLLEGKTLQTTAEHPAPEHTVDWIIQLADALEHAHNAGVIHCDLKPSNVVVTSDRAVLTDFGLAHLQSSQRNRILSGTAPWMAPEQVDEWFGPVTRATDVYGLGALLYTLLSGRPPFVSEFEVAHSSARTPDILCRVVSLERPKIPSGLSATAEELFNISLSCLAREPDRRPESVAVIRQQLRNLRLV